MKVFSDIFNKYIIVNKTPKRKKEKLEDNRVRFSH